MTMLYPFIILVVALISLSLKLKSIRHKRDEMLKQHKEQIHDSWCNEMTGKYPDGFIADTLPTNAILYPREYLSDKIEIGDKLIIGWNAQVKMELESTEYGDYIVYGCVLSSGLRIAVTPRYFRRELIVNRYRMVEIIKELVQRRLLKTNDDVTLYFSYTRNNGYRFTLKEGI